jgi:collagen type VII alpha
MIYGSSPYTQRNIVGTTGPTGNTGPTGSTGNDGNLGATGRTGNTGGNVIGITLVNNTVITTFSDNTSFVGSNIIGETGSYYIFVGAANVSGDGIPLVSGVSYEYSNTSAVGSVRVRGFTRYNL